ncbi:MAG: hypothetical protein IH987_21395 [Planctomycetes bacterium]|nr:hypothetical protein [Planctomycetota bacterium]
MVGRKMFMLGIVIGGMAPTTLADETFQVSGTGNGTGYGLVISVDGDKRALLDSDTAGLSASDFVARWKMLFATGDPVIVLNIDPNDATKFTIVGTVISVRVGPIGGGGTEVVGNQDGVPFNPTLFWLSPGVPTVSVWGMVFMTLPATTVGTLVFFRMRRSVRG